MGYDLVERQFQLGAERDESAVTSWKREAFINPWSLARGKFQAKGRVKASAKNGGECEL